MPELTRLLDAVVARDCQAAVDLLSRVYDELRNLAAEKIASEIPGHTFNATVLIHKVDFRLVGDQDFDSPDHYFADSVEAVQRILVYQTLAKQTDKRGSHQCAWADLDPNCLSVSALDSDRQFAFNLTDFQREIDVQTALLGRKKYADPLRWPVMSG
jgi:hypothetical protein